MITVYALLLFQAKSSSSARVGREEDEVRPAVVDPEEDLATCSQPFLKAKTEDDLTRVKLQ
jgi:hypothetical protein